MYVYGIASTADRETNGYVLAAGAFNLSTMPPLLYAHDLTKVAGRILYLGYHGDRLLCRAKVTLPEAQSTRYFSVGCRALETDGKTVKGRLFEVSLVHEAANSACVILERSEKDPMADLMELQSAHWDNLGRAFMALRECVEQMGRC